MWQNWKKRLLWYVTVLKKSKDAFIPSVLDVFVFLLWGCGCHHFFTVFSLELTNVRFAPQDITVYLWQHFFLASLALYITTHANVRRSSFPNSDFSIKNKKITNPTKCGLVCLLCRCLRVNERDGWWQSTGRTSRCGCRSYTDALDVICPLE